MTSKEEQIHTYSKRPLCLIAALGPTISSNRLAENKSSNYPEFTAHVENKGITKKNRCLLHAKVRIPEEPDQNKSAYFAQVIDLGNLFKNTLRALNMDPDANCNLHPLFDAVYENQEKTRQWLESKTANQAETTQQPTTPEKTTTSFATMNPEQRSNWIENLQDAKSTPTAQELHEVFQFLLDNNALPKLYQDNNGKVSSEIQERSSAIRTLKILKINCVKRALRDFSSAEKTQQSLSRQEFFKSNPSLIQHTMNQYFAQLINAIAYLQMSLIIIPNADRSDVEQKIKTLTEGTEVVLQNFQKYITDEFLQDTTSQSEPAISLRRVVTAKLQEMSNIPTNSNVNLQHLNEVISALINMVEQHDNKEILDYFKQVNVETRVDNGRTGEDSVACNKEKKWYVVGDGMGGLDGGKKASLTLCRETETALDALPKPPTTEEAHANIALALEQAKGKISPPAGTTASIAQLAVNKENQPCVVLGKAGDGQDFIISKDGTLVQAATVLDSVHKRWVQKQITDQQYELLKKDKANHTKKSDMSNVGQNSWDNSYSSQKDPNLPILQGMSALGSKYSSPTEINEIIIQEGDLGLISMTDGVTDPLTFSKIQDLCRQAVNNNNLNELPQHLITAARQANDLAAQLNDRELARFNAGKRDDIGIGLMLFPDKLPR